MGMAYDGATGRVVLFGGLGEDTIFGDTWSWDGTDWTQLTPAHSPPPRFDPAMTYDAALGQIVLFGGVGDGYPPPQRHMDVGRHGLDATHAGTLTRTAVPDGDGRRRRPQPSGALWRERRRPGAPRRHLDLGRH
jgi:hypothetical protein